MTATLRLRPWEDEDLAVFRTSVRAFMDAEVVPHQLRWRQQHHVDRAFWRRAGEAGLLCLASPEALGGSGSVAADLVVLEEQYRAGEAGWGNMVHSGIVPSYLMHLGSDEQQEQWLPDLASGAVVAAIAMSEPGAGSDLRGITTRAVRDGDDYVITGSKTFITNGCQADLVILAAKTEPGRGSDTVTLFLLDTRELAGFRRGQPLDKIGLGSGDTSELFLDDVRVPAASVLGQVGRGMQGLMQELPLERLLIAVAAVAAAEAAVDQALSYTKERHAFNAPLFDLQHVRFELADCATLVAVGRAFVDDCVVSHLGGTLDTATASMAKVWATDMQNTVVDRCLQLFGGYGYMNEYPIARAFVDARVQKIYGGANEVLREVIARAL